MNAPEKNFDIPEEGIWSVRTGAISYMVEDRQRRHFFPLLVDESNPARPRILDEIHFGAVDGQGFKNPDPAGPLFLSAAAYTKPDRASQVSFVSTHARDTPRKIMALWNEACRAAVEIREKHLPFSPNDCNCATGTRTVVSNVQQAFAEARETSADAAALRADYRVLRRQLARPPVRKRAA